MSALWLHPDSSVFVKAKLFYNWTVASWDTGPWLRTGKVDIVLQRLYSLFPDQTANSIHDQWRLFIVKKCPQKDISPGFAATWEWVTWAAVQAEKPSLPFSSPLFRGNPEVFPSQLKRAAGSLYSSLSTTQEQETKCPDGRHKVCSEQSWTGQFRVEYGHQQSRKNPWPKSMFLAGVSGESTVNRLMIEPVTFLL